MQVFNAGPNTPQAVKEILENNYTIIDDIVEYHDILQKLKNKNTVGEIYCQFVDYEKFKDYFGWTPRHSFNDGILKTIDWYKRYLRER